MLPASPAAFRPTDGPTRMSLLATATAPNMPSTAVGWKPRF